MKSIKRQFLSLMVLTGISAYAYADRITVSAVNNGVEPVTVTLACLPLPALCPCSNPVVFNNMQPGESQSATVEGAYCCFVGSLQTGGSVVKLSPVKCVEHKLDLTLTQDANGNWQGAFRAD